MNKYLQRERIDKAKMRPPELYIACEDIDFSWLPEEIAEFIRLWTFGYSLEAIATNLDRPLDDVTILLYDQASKGKVQARKGGLYGSLILCGTDKASASSQNDSARKIC
jgi:hypothetical protein